MIIRNRWTILITLVLLTACTSAKSVNTEAVLGKQKITGLKTPESVVQALNGNIYVTLEDSSLCQIDKKTGKIIKTVVLNENIDSILSKNLQKWQNKFKNST